jgi:CHAT domain-containing protein
VLGDPRGDLQGARTEADQVAALLGTTSKTGSAATKAALFAAASDAVLHVAAHAGRGLDGPGLQLAGGDVSALEISANHVAPSLAVLSSCDAAAANDDDIELASSLIAAFLSSGSQHVVATLLSVSDHEALDVSIRFYHAGGVTDPVRALQAAQRELLQTSNIAWPQYAVFGPDVCPDDASHHP